MKPNSIDKFRLAIFVTLLSKSTNPLGRTAIVKLAYILQNVCDVPLQYNFHLYTYGPYDSDVLADVKSAVSMSLLKSSTVVYSNGSTGYEYSLEDKQPSVNELTSLCNDFLPQIEWVAKQFSSMSASRLELITTILFVKSEKGIVLNQSQIANRVNEIKPHFSVDIISKQIEELSKELSFLTWNR